MFESFPLPVLLAIFAVGAVAVWLAGTRLSESTDVLSERLHLGSALGGAILLAFATNLPEIAITVSASLSGNVDIAVGNILGGIAIQTVVLVLLDIFGTRGKKPLSYSAASLALVLEGTLVGAVLVIAIIGSRLPASLIFLHVEPGSLLIAVLWVVGLWLLSKARKDLPWQIKVAGDVGGQQDEAGEDKNEKDKEGAGKDKDDKGKEGESSKQDKKDKDKKSTGHAALVFAVAAVITLAAGVALEESGNSIAGQLGLSGVLFGSTILAAATALPELATGLEAVKLGDYKLAFSDIFGGNAFLPVLFLVASLISGKAVLPQAKNVDIYLAALGILLTTVYIYGLIFRPQRRVLGMGVDSLVVLVLYALGLAGLFFVAA